LTRVAETGAHMKVVQTNWAGALMLAIALIALSGCAVVRHSPVAIAPTYSHVQAGVMLDTTNTCKNTLRVAHAPTESTVSRD
jgi:hypothetical protein